MLLIGLTPAKRSNSITSTNKLTESLQRLIDSHIKVFVGTANTKSVVTTATDILKSECEEVVRRKGGKGKLIAADAFDWKNILVGAEDKAQKAINTFVRNH